MIAKYLLQPWNCLDWESFR